MANQQELEKLHANLLNRKCYTMADVIKGSLDEGSDGQSSTEILRKFKSSPWYGMISRHTKSQDATAAINELSSVVLEAAVPDAIGRDLARVIETKRDSIKVRLPSAGKARSTSKGKLTTSKGQRETFVTLTPDKEIEASEEWDRNYLEDADWDVASEEAAEVARSLAEKESSLIITQLKNVAAADLAGGGNLGAITAGTLTFNDLANLWGRVKAENFSPNVVAMHPDQATDLFKDADFKNQLILGEFLDFENGRFGRTILGFTILVSSLMTQQHVYMLNSNLAVLYALKRDRLAIPYEKPPHTSGIQISSRYDLKDGRTKAFARMIDA